MNNDFDYLIVLAYSIYPEISSSEGIVNRNWLEALDNTEISSLIFSKLTTNCVTRDPLGMIVISSREDKKLKVLAQLSKNKKSVLANKIYKAANKIIQAFSRHNLSLNEYAWGRFQSSRLKKIASATNGNYPIWMRVLPGMSMLPIYMAIKHIDTPLLINFNDPFSLEDLNHSKAYKKYDSIVIQMRDRIQCYTFPSWPLALRIASRYNLDLEQCFVIPHATDFNDYGNLTKPLESDRNIILSYAGTLYQSAFSEELSSAIAEHNGKIGTRFFELQFIISQYTSENLNWLKKNFSGLSIYKRLDRPDVLNKLKDSDIILIVESKDHKDLLKGKLVEAIALGKPIFCITSKASVTEKIALEYGGFVAYADEPETILEQLNLISKCLSDPKWVNEFNLKKERVREKLSNRNIAKKSLQILKFAADLYRWEKGILETRPDTPLLPRWP
ncbi:hypothetical protein [Croceiramulus getboli]|nr:hypothetical protein P8624_08420 [Flavobacteriaceae bacterium YJPT1-3]